MECCRIALVVSFIIAASLIIGCGGSDSLQPVVPDEEGRPPIVSVPMGQSFRNVEGGTKFELVPINGRSDIASHSFIVLPKDDRYEKYSVGDWQFSVMEYGYDREYLILQPRGLLQPGVQYALRGWPRQQEKQLDELATFTVGDAETLDDSEWLAKQLFVYGYSRIAPMGNQFGIFHNEHNLGHAFVDIRDYEGEILVTDLNDREVVHLREPEKGQVWGFDYTHFTPILEPGRGYKVETSDPELGPYEFWTINWDWPDPFYPPTCAKLPVSRTVSWEKSQVVVLEGEDAVADGADAVGIEVEVAGYDGKTLTMRDISSPRCFNSGQELYRETIAGPMFASDGSEAILTWKITTELNGRRAYVIQVTDLDGIKVTLDTVVIDWQRP